MNDPERAQYIANELRRIKLLVDAFVPTWDAAQRKHIESKRNNTDKETTHEKG